MSYLLRNRQKNFKRWRRQGEASTESGKLPYEILFLIGGSVPYCSHYNYPYNVLVALIHYEVRDEVNQKVYEV
jgi:hypothetical protein